MTQVREAKRIAESLGVMVTDVSFDSRHIVLRVAHDGRHLGALRLSRGTGTDPRHRKQLRGRIRGLIRGTNRIGAMTGVRA